MTLSRKTLPLSLPRVALIYGRGIEGCGVTRWGAELQDWMRAGGHTCDVYAYGRKSFLRGKAQRIDYTAFSGDDVPAMIADLNAGTYDVVIYTSVPVVKTEPQDLDAFYRLIYGVTRPVKCFYSFENTTRHQKNTPYLPLIINDVDQVYGLQTRQDSWLRAKVAELGKELRQTKNWMDFARFDGGVPFARRNHEVLYLGRNSGFKNLPLTLEFMKVAQKVDPELACTFRGVEAGNATAFWLRDEEGFVYHYDETNVAKWGTPGPIHFWNAYDYEDGMHRIGQAKFGISLAHIEPVRGEGINHMEYAMMEIIAQGAVPLFHRRWLETTTLDGSGCSMADFNAEFPFCIPVDENDLESAAVAMLNVGPGRAKKMNENGKVLLNQQYAADKWVPQHLREIVRIGKQPPMWHDDRDVIAHLTKDGQYAMKAGEYDAALHRFGDFEKRRVVTTERRGSKIEEVEVTL